jgi:hypothetical protein
MKKLFQTINHKFSTKKEVKPEAEAISERQPLFFIKVPNEGTREDRVRALAEALQKQGWTITDKKNILK